MDTHAQRKISEARFALLDALGGRLDIWQTAEVSQVVAQLNHLVLTDPSPPECPVCASFLLQPATGRLRTYCTDACRQTAARLRQQDARRSD
jgi:hypothetical protein